ncbi:hypothetical protein ACJMK2_040371 [Sinanodonta woodiana]|uniref:Uncharacterized protein n=1 Tax=Sinanodonta woodiana TaxID=1069815 RepID=A0ABD3WFZ7_SINWO
MSVAAAPTTGTRVAPSVSTSVSHAKSIGQDARPNTGVLNTLFRQIQMPPQKLPTSRIPSIVARMQRDTKSSKAKKGKWYRGDNYVDKNHYSWKNLSLFSDYQAQMWTNDGGIKQTCKK